jgi:hypothetical protein
MISHISSSSYYLPYLDILLGHVSVLVHPHVLIEYALRINFCPRLLHAHASFRFTVCGFFIIIIFLRIIVSFVYMFLHLIKVVVSIYIYTYFTYASFIYFFFFLSLASALA